MRIIDPSNAGNAKLKTTLSGIASLNSMLCREGDDEDPTINVRRRVLLDVSLAYVGNIQKSRLAC